MPELPEVETTRRTLAGVLTGARIRRVVVRQPDLRWPVPAGLPTLLQGRRITGMQRRAKYLLIGCAADNDHGHLLVHLGMSGVLCVRPLAPPGPHDHVDVELVGGTVLRYTDPRRFGCMLWLPGAEPQHPLLEHLGPEPFHESFTGEALHRVAAARRAPVKPFIMDQRVVVGVGNIYASEALFAAGIHPARAAGRIAYPRMVRLVAAIRHTLQAAIAAGGASIRDYRQGDGQPGDFQTQVQVYDRAGQPCVRCSTSIRMLRQAGRASYYCPRCQR
jgi:formamidopyrimidine-DNA glycosylase